MHIVHTASDSFSLHIIGILAGIWQVAARPNYVLNVDGGGPQGNRPHKGGAPQASERMSVGRAHLCVARPGTGGEGGQGSLFV